MKTRVRLTTLFFTRLALYFLLIILPLFHAAIVVPYDRPGWVFWFFLIPLELCIAYFLAPPRLAFKPWVLTALITAGFISVVMSGFTISTLLLIAGGMLGFLLTTLIFGTKGRGRIFAVLELFYSGFIYYRLLSFSRASEDIAQQSHGFTQIIMVIAICAFCFHALIIYFASFEERLQKKSKREFALVAGLSIPLVLLILLVLPPDFISNNIVLNNLGEEPQSKSLGDSDILDSFNENGVPKGPGEQGGNNKLEGVPRDRWNSIKRKDNKQYAAMLVVTKADPLYAAGNYLSYFDSLKGFIASQNPSLEDTELNNLKNRHLLLTWNWPFEKREADKQEEYTAQYFSITPERYIGYMPLSVEPTALTQDARPFNYSSYSVSGLAKASLPDLIKLGDWSEKEKQKILPYLKVNIDQDLKERLKQTIDSLLKKDAGLYAKVMVLLQYFRAYRYEAGFTEDSSTGAIERFLFETRSGDCTEFSHAFALLARLSGIPARVVTGYLVAKKLQTPAHRQGVAILKQQLGILKDYPVEDIYLVTSSHRHSWAQVYLPGLGWMDIETTQFAMPPASGQDPNDWQVVIPYDDKSNKEQDNLTGADLFFWLRILLFLAAFFLLLVIGIYLYRYGLLVYFYLRRKKRDARALQALYTLLLMQLAFRGYGLKKPDQTIINYAAQYPELLEFAQAYTVLRYQKNLTTVQRESYWQNIEAAFVKIMGETNKHTIKHTLLSWFSLRGLFYKW